MRKFELTKETNECDRCGSNTRIALTVITFAQTRYEKAFTHHHLVNIHHFGIVVCRGRIFETLGALGGAMERQILELGISGGI